MSPIKRISHAQILQYASSAVLRPSLFQRQGPDTINIQVPFGAPACYPFWNRGPKLLIETECVLQKLLRSERFREVTHRRACSAKRLAELAFQVSLHAFRFDGLVLDHCPHSVRRIDIQPRIIKGTLWERSGILEGGEVPCFLDCCVSIRVLING